MKKYILTMALAAASLSSFAQAPAGNCIDVDFDAFEADGNTLRYIRVPFSEEFNFGSEMTIEAWVRAHDFNWNQKIIGKTNIADEGFVFGVDQGQFYSEVWSPNQSQVLDGFIPPTPELSYFKHLVFTFTGEDAIRGYINGNLISEVTIVGTQVGEGNSDLIIGIAPWGDNNAFMFFGEVDEIKLWNRVLDEEEIRANMHISRNGDEEGLVAYYDCNETGAMLTDQTTNGNNGIFEGGMVAENIQPSFAVLGDDIIAAWNEPKGLWNGGGLADPRFAITNNGLSLLGSNIPSHNYSVYAHNDAAGTSQEGIASNAPANFERTAREWYMNSVGNMNIDFSFNLENAAGGGTVLELAGSAENYALLYRENPGDVFQFIANGNAIQNGVATFSNINALSGYYAIGYGDTPAILNNINELEAGKLNLFPNPTNGMVTIKANTAKGSVLQVFDVAGKMVMSENYNSFNSSLNLDLSTFETGLYTVKLSGKSGVYSAQLIKE